MKVGDLIKHTPSGDLGFIINVDLWGYTMVKWLDGFGALDDVERYYGEWGGVWETGGPRGISSVAQARTGVGATAPSATLAQTIRSS